MRSIFDKHGQTAAPAPPTAPADKPDYRAAEPFLANEDRLRLSFQLSNGDKVQAPYGLLLSVLQKGPNWLWLTFNIGRFEIEGENLDGIYETLETGNSIKRLVPFNPQHHNEPEAGAPVIHRLDALDPQR